MNEDSEISLLKKEVTELKERLRTLEENPEFDDVKLTQMILQVISSNAPLVSPDPH